VWDQGKAGPALIASTAGNAVPSLGSRVNLGIAKSGFSLARQQISKEYTDIPTDQQKRNILEACHQQETESKAMS
jgi:hypothetical protein